MASCPFQSILKYKPLNPDHAEIRLLEVRPAKGVNEPFQSRLVHMPLTDRVSYIGLSLLHGDAANTELIIVNGKALYFPSSIGEALREVRTMFSPGKALDGLCSDPSMGLDQQSSAYTAYGKSHLTRPSTSTESTSTSTTSSSQSSGTPPQSESNSWRKTNSWLRNTFRNPRSNKRQDSLSLSPRGPEGKTQPLRIWLDALCMNAQDTCEMSRRRSHTALAYREARLVVGWLGHKDEDAVLSIQFMTTLADAAPARFGEPKHRRQHPEHYGPIMEFLKPLNIKWEVGPGLRAEDHPIHQALKSFLGRSYFCNNWILAELAQSRHPGFLVGDMFVSWLQILRWVCVCEETAEKGSLYFPDENRGLLNYLPLESLYLFLEEYDRRMEAQLEI